MPTRTRCLDGCGAVANYSNLIIVLCWCCCGSCCYSGVYRSFILRALRANRTPAIGSDLALASPRGAGPRYRLGYRSVPNDCGYGLFSKPAPRMHRSPHGRRRKSTVCGSSRCSVRQALAADPRRATACDKLLDPRLVEKIRIGSATATDPVEPAADPARAQLGGGIGRHELHLVIAVTVAYTAVVLVEGTGLWLRRRWAEWVTVSQRPH